MRWLLLFLGGGLGAVLRYELAGWVQGAAGPSWPWGTFAVNAAGCFAIGWLATWIDEHGGGSAALRLFLVPGLLGGFTTFSAFGLETWRLLEQGALGPATGNVLASVGVCLAAVAAGVVVGRL
jgi:CrcB protein